jgi:uncharacterized protein YjbJ (UPF0337 family)
MNWNVMAGRWKQWRGKAKERWGRLKDNDLQVIRGRREQLVGKLQELYGIVRVKAERQVARFERFLGAPPSGGRVVRYRIRVVRRRRSSTQAVSTRRRSR